VSAPSAVVSNIRHGNAILPVPTKLPNEFRQTGGAMSDPYNEMRSTTTSMVVFEFLIQYQEQALQFRK